MYKRDLSLDLICHLFYPAIYGGKYDGFILLKKRLPDKYKTMQAASSYDVAKQGVSLLFRLFGSFNSSTYISSDVWRRDSR